MCLLTLIFTSCANEKQEMAELDSTPYVLAYGNLPSPDLPEDNPLTVQGVALGRMLFFEKKLSRDNTISCASCHKQQEGFSDSRTFSLGVENRKGTRQAMSVFNMAWHKNAFFWDGRAPLLRNQALMPIEDHLQMDESLENVISKLSKSTMY